jgi:hypothetical protein
MTGRTVLVQHLHLGAKGTPETVNSAELPLPGQLGQIYESAGKFYRLVKHQNVDDSGTAAASASRVAYWYDKANWIVTADASGSEGGPNSVAGGYLGAIADGNYGFVQMGGTQVMRVDNSGIGSQMSGNTADDELVETSPGTPAVNKIVAIALAADAGAGGAETALVRWEFAKLL